MPLGGSTAATLTIKIVTDASKAAQGFSDVGSSASRLQSGLGTAAKWGGVASAALIAFGTSAFDAASDAEQAGGAVDAVFKGNAEQVHGFADAAADATGLASSQYEQMASVFGAQLKNMGMASDDLAPMTDDLIGLGADLAAQFGGDTSDAVEALSSLLRGERDPIERYGVSIKQADIDARKAAMGMDDLTGEADRQATTMATLSLLTDQTADAHGAFAREADTAAGQQQRANAAFEDAKASLGEALLPVVSDAADVFKKLAQFVGRNAPAFRLVAGVIIGLTAAVWGVLAVTKAWTVAQQVAKAATLAWQAAQWLLNAAMNANPIGLIILAVAALVAGIILLWKNCKTFRTIVKAAGRIAVKAFEAVVDAVAAVWEWVKKLFQWVKSNWPKIAAILAGPVGIAVLIIIKHWKTIIDWIKKVIDWVKDKLGAAWRAMRDVAVGLFDTIRRWVNIAIMAVGNIIDWIKTRLVGAWRYMKDVAVSVFDTIRRWVSIAVLAVGNLIGWVRNTLTAAWRYAKDVAVSAFDTVRRWVQIVVLALGTLIGWIRNSLANAYRYAKDVAVSAFDTVRRWVDIVILAIGRLVGWVRNTLVSAYNVALWVGTAAFNGVASAVGWVIDKVTWLAGIIRGVLVGAFQTAQWVGTVAFNALTGPIQWVIDKINSLIGWIGNIHWPTPPSWVRTGAGWIGGIFGHSMPVPPTVARPYRYAVTTPTTFGPTGLASSRAATPGGVTINVHGALDPDSVARQIERLLVSRQRRVSGPHLVGVR